MIDSIMYILQCACFIALSLIFLFVLFFIFNSAYKISMRKMFMKPGVTGKPDLVLPFWKPRGKNSPSISIQKMVLDLFGKKKTDAELNKRQSAFRDERSNISFLINSYGIKTKWYENDRKNPEETMVMLWESLKSGKLILCPANSYLLRNPDPEFNTEKDPTYNHVILVTGLERSDEGKIKVWYSDTDHHNGAILDVSYEGWMKSTYPIFLITPPVPGLKDGFMQFNTGISAAILLVISIAIYCFYSYFGWLIK